MFIYNLNIKKLKRLSLVAIVFILVVLTLFFVFYMFKHSKKSFVKDECSPPEVTEIPVANYTNILKDCYENLDNYIR